MRKKLRSQKKIPTTFYFIRHGETDWNKQGKWQGHTDIPLNEIGRLQAAQVAEFFKNKELHAFYSSDLIRAHETAKIVAQPHKKIVSPHHALRERYGGSLEGKNKEEVKKIIGLTDNFPADVEKIEAAIERIVNFLKQIAPLHSGKNVLIGSHAGIMRILLIHWGHIQSTQTFGVRINNGAHMRVSFDGDSFRVVDTVGVKLEV